MIEKLSTIEQLPKEVERISFDSLKSGDVINIACKGGTVYNFVTEKVNAWPTGYMEVIEPDGTIIEPFPINIYGSEELVLNDQNHSETQLRKFIPNNYELVVGNYLSVGPTDNIIGGRVIIGDPDQEIFEITTNKNLIVTEKLKLLNTVYSS